MHFGLQGPTGPNGSPEQWWKHIGQVADPALICIPVHFSPVPRDGPSPWMEAPMGDVEKPVRGQVLPSEPVLREVLGVLPRHG